MRVVFIAAGPIEFASSRIRCYWPAAYMDAEVWQLDDVIDGLRKDAPVPADTIVFQKRVDPGVARNYRSAGHRIIWDVCDPSWWWEPALCREIAGNIDGVVASSWALARDFNEWYGEEIATCIPDSLELSHFPKQRHHAPADPVRFIWYGIAVNRVALNAAIANLERLAANGHNIELTVMDDRPDARANIAQRFPLYHVRWQLDKENAIIAGHDVALLPRYPGPWGQVKSNNKDLTAWACGLPVTRGVNYDRMTHLMDASYREAAAKAGRALLVEQYQAEQSAKEWGDLLC